MSANSRQIGGSHYKGSVIEHWDLIEGFELGYMEGCATKYLARWRKKNGVVDLEKARHYTEKLAEMCREGSRGPVGHVPAAFLDMFCKSAGMDSLTERAFRRLCTWREWRDLWSTLGMIERLIAQASEPNTPGTPEDGGHAAKAEE